MRFTDKRASQLSAKRYKLAAQRQLDEYLKKGDFHTETEALKAVNDHGFLVQDGTSNYLLFSNQAVVNMVLSVLRLERSNYLHPEHRGNQPMGAITHEAPKDEDTLYEVKITQEMADFLCGPGAFPRNRIFNSNGTQRFGIIADAFQKAMEDAPVLAAPDAAPAARNNDKVFELTDDKIDGKFDSPDRINRTIVYKYAPKSSASLDTFFSTHGLFVKKSRGAFGSGKVFLDENKSTNGTYYVYKHDLEGKLHAEPSEQRVSSIAGDSLPKAYTVKG